MFALTCREHRYRRPQAVEDRSGCGVYRQVFRNGRTRGPCSSRSCPIAAAHSTIRYDARAAGRGAMNATPASEIMTAMKVHTLLVWPCSVYVRRVDRELRTFFRATFLPFLRASERPIAIACFLLVTFFPLFPLLSVPLLRRRIADSTSFEALFEVFRFTLPQAIWLRRVTASDSLRGTICPSGCSATRIAAVARRPYGEQRDNLG